MSDKDYSLLRPFDREAAKRGEPICYRIDGSKRIYMTGPDNANHLCVEDPADGRFVLAHVDKYRMAPLAWVEGKPVYKGDGPLFIKDNGEKVFVSRSGLIERPTNVVAVCILEHRLTWTPPKVKREGWVNIYPKGEFHVRDSKEDADNCARHRTDRVACVRIEWEEPADLEGKSA